jgi:hypothetical protein
VTIRIFIGTESKTELARKVLEFSIRRRTAAAVEFIPMIGPDWEYSRKGIKVGTGFSLRRWMIPGFCAWKGRAIYLDADQLVLSDINDLWVKPSWGATPGGTVWCTAQPDRHNKTAVWQTSVMAIDCVAARGWKGWELSTLLDYLRRHGTTTAYNAVMRGQLAGPLTPIPDCWNHLDRCVPGETKLLHYTNMRYQPWYNPKHPLADLWKQELRLAILAGYIPRDMFENALARWNKAKLEGLHPEYAKLLPLFR